MTAHAAAMAPGGWRFARFQRGWRVHSATGVEIWRDKPLRPAGFGAALSDDGCRLAYSRKDWMVTDIETDRVLERGPGSIAAFAFDGRGEQLGLARIDGPSLVVRIGAPHPRPRVEMPGGCAIALDRRGVLAAFAYTQAPPIARGRLRVDTLDSGDMTWLDCDLADIAAIAFSPDSHRLACIASSGAVEVLPVP